MVFLALVYGGQAKLTIKNNISNNIKLLEIIYQNYKQEDEKEEFISTNLQSNNKNPSINQVNSINLNYHNDFNKKNTKEKMKHYINTNEIIKQRINSLYRDKKKYNNLIKKFENDMKNKQINISSMSEQNIESYFIDYISQDISNFISAIQSFRIRHKTTHIGK